jgi:hypothetical protein
LILSSFRQIEPKLKILQLSVQIDISRKNIIAIITKISTINSLTYFPEEKNARTE